MSLGWALSGAELAAGFWRVFLVKPCVFAVQLPVWLFRGTLLCIVWTGVAVAWRGRGVVRLAHRDKTRRRAPRRVRR